MNEPEILAETENFTVYVTEDPEEGEMFHVDLGLVELHMVREEFQELLEIIRTAEKKVRR